MMIEIATGPAAAPASRHVVYLPFVANTSAAPVGVITDPVAVAFFVLLVTDPRQRRDALRVCPALMVAAARRAAMVAKADALSHCDPYGLCANAYAAAAGCSLPGHYPANGNSIECLAAGSPDAAPIFAALAASESHARALFGESDFFRAQRKIGIAVLEAPGSRWGWYWVILIAECGQVSGE